MAEWKILARDLPTRERKIPRWVHKKPRITVASAEGSPSPIPGRNIEDDRRRGLAAVMAHRATQNQATEGET